jgi:DNA-directed RNA polymerase I subunit RPA12
MSFCTVCNNLLPTPQCDEIICRYCGTHCTWANVPANSLDRTTSSGSRPEPTWLLRRQKESQQGGSADLAVVDEPCPKCNFAQAKFYTLQLRSVDEGSTVFYECLSCKNKWNQDN